MSKHLTATRGECAVAGAPHSAARNTPARRGKTMASALCLAATPVFAAMALLAAGSGDAAMLCGTPHGMSPPGGMALMYALMAIFHAAPWQKLACRRLARTR
jgi:hypothetical protein